MGLWQRLFGKPSPSVPPQASVHVSVGALVQVAGTTTFAKEGAAEVAARFADGQDYAELHAIVKAGKPDILVDGIRIGCLPAHMARELAENPEDTLRFSVQVFLSGTPTGKRVDAWAWLGEGLPRWRYSRSRRPPITTDERAREAQRERSETVRDALRAGGPQSSRIQTVMVDGLHYLELVEPIKQLKRDGELQRALKLCYRAIEGAEKDRGVGAPAPFYTLQAAIIHRQLRQPAAEVAVLLRWLALCPPERRDGSHVSERLNKLHPNGGGGSNAET